MAWSAASFLSLIARNNGNVKAKAVTPESTIYSHARFIPSFRASKIMKADPVIATIRMSRESTQSTAEPN